MMNVYESHKCYDECYNYVRYHNEKFEYHEKCYAYDRYGILMNATILILVLVNVINIIDVMLDLKNPLLSFNHPSQFLFYYRDAHTVYILCHSL